VSGILAEFVARGVLDGDVVAVATEDMEGSWSAATRAG